MGKLNVIYIKKYKGVKECDGGCADGGFDGGFGMGPVDVIGGPDRWDNIIGGMQFNSVHKPRKRKLKRKKQSKRK